MLVAVIHAINSACCCHPCNQQHVYYLIVASSCLAMVGLLSSYAPWQYDCFSQHQKYYVVASLAMQHQGYAFCCHLCAWQHIMFHCYMVGRAIPLQLSLVLACTLAIGPTLAPLRCVPISVITCSLVIQHKDMLIVIASCDQQQKKLIVAFPYHTATPRFSRC
jgi:hypothetical protein